MKKYLALILGAVFVLGFAASAFAIHAEIPAETQAIVAKGKTQITLGGEIRVRGEFQQNTADFNDDAADHKAYYDERVRLRLQADVTKGTTAVVHLESGDAAKSDFTWGTETAEAKGVYPYGNGKQGLLYILEAWIEHKGSGLLGIPAGLKVGHMPLALGNKLFYDHSKFGDDAVVFYMDPNKELHIGLLTAKFTEGAGTVSKNDDATAYVGLFAYKPNKDTSISGDISYVDHQNGALGVTGQNAHLWNFGLRGSTQIGALRLMADVEIQTGEVTDRAGGAAAVDFNGYALMAGISYKFNPVTLSLTYAYGSGGDSGNGVTDANGDYSGFITALSGVQNYTYVYDYRTRTSAGSAGTGIANTQYVKLSAAADLSKSVKGNLDLYWLRAAEDVNTYSGGPKSDEIGVELDGKITYAIEKNLTYWVEGGYLWAGDMYNISATKSADNAYAIRHGISLSF